LSEKFALIILSAVVVAELECAAIVFSYVASVIYRVPDSAIIGDTVCVLYQFIIYAAQSLIFPIWIDLLSNLQVK
jgi:hypothetical protein